MITIDSREPDELVELINEEGGDYEVEYMQAGDFASGDFLIERKEYGDFIGRITQSERDIWQQILGLETAAKEIDRKPVLLLEGTWSDAMRWSNINPVVVTKTIASIMKLGINVCHAMDMRATSHLLIKWDDGKSHDIGSIRDTPSVPPELYPRYLTESFVGVGPSRAEDILERYGSFAAIIHQLETEPDDLKEISGVGESTVEKMVDMVTTEWEADE